MKHNCSTFKHYTINFSVAHLSLIFQVIRFVCVLLECFLLVTFAVFLSLSFTLVFTQSCWTDAFKMNAGINQKEKNTSLSLSLPTTSFSTLLFPVDMWT